MSKNKYRLIYICQTLIASIYPFAQIITSRYKKNFYNPIPALLLAFVYPLIIGAILYFIRKTAIDKTLSAIFLAINIFVVIVIWKFLPGVISTYNLIICGVLLLSIFDKKPCEI